MKHLNLKLLIMIISLSVPFIASAESSDVDFKGTLVAEPCTVATGGDGENVVVDFGTIPDKNFYYDSPPRTWLQSFHILLKECDLSLGTQVKVTFTGTEDPEQPGRLAVTSSSGVSHVAIGIQDFDGKDIAINKQTKNYTLNTGITELRFKSYIQASSDGVKNHSVGFGKFDSITTFELEYP